MEININDRAAFTVTLRMMMEALRYDLDATYKTRLDTLENRLNATAMTALTLDDIAPVENMDINTKNFLAEFENMLGQFEAHTLLYKIAETEPPT